MKKTTKELQAPEVSLIKGEMWLPVNGTNNAYWISNHGRLMCTNWRGTGRKRVMLPAKDGKGYLRTMIKYPDKYRTVKVHRLVAQAWIPLVDGKNHVDHINSNKQDNRCENLQWVTNRENTMKAYKEGRFKSFKGSKNGTSKLTESDVRELRILFKQGWTRKQLGEKYGVAPATIKDAILRRWKHVK